MTQMTIAEFNNTRRASAKSHLAALQVGTPVLTLAGWSPVVSESSKKIAGRYICTIVLANGAEVVGRTTDLVATR